LNAWALRPYWCASERGARVDGQYRRQYDVTTTLPTAEQMSYKTVLVHMNDERRADRLREPAMALARTFQAHLVALSVLPPVIVATSGGLPAVPPYTVVVDEHRDAYRQQAERMQQAFETIDGGQGLTLEWRLDDAGEQPVADAVLKHGRCTDLIIAGQTDPAWSGSHMLDVGDRLAMESGRPVLLIPNAGQNTTTGKRIVVAWNGRREAARAVFDALPLLRRAEDVEIVEVAAPGEGDAVAARTSGELSQALLRHGMRCVAKTAADTESNVGRALLLHVAGHRADLLVMGCYGHSRLREFVFGGATRHVLQHMTVPVLMSH